MGGGQRYPGAQSGGKRVGRVQEWGQKKNGEKEDMEPEEKWEQGYVPMGAI